MYKTDWNAFEQSERLDHTPALMRETFAERVEGSISRSPDQIGSDTRLSEHNRRLLAQATAHGVTVLASTDTGAVNSYLFSGDSLHGELAELVSVSLTPLQALRAATIDAAQWLEEDADYGTLEAGKTAHFVVLRSNPLGDISNTRAIEAVVQGGRYIRKKELHGLRQLRR